jgi:uncharacterized protein YraI
MVLGLEVGQMEKHLRRSFWLIILALIPLLAACDDVTVTPTPSANQGPVAAVPTRTLGPIVSFTPRFTATPIPSATFTPSMTPTPTITTVPPTRTLTPTSTVTPTVEGRVSSGENVNLREGPGTDYAIVASVPPGSTLGVLGLQADSHGREWFKVAYTESDGEVLLAWIASSLITTDFREIVVLNASTPVPGAATPVPGAATRTPGATALNAPTPEPNRVEILAYCSQKGITPKRPTTSDNVYIEWSWYVARPELMDEHLQNAHYEVRLDGRLLENWTRYATQMREEDGVWIVYWYFPAGKLSVGEHKIEYRLTWEQAISDGYAQFGPDTPNEDNTGDCTFTVVES